MDNNHENLQVQTLKYLLDCALAQSVTRFSPQRPGFNPRSVSIGFVVNKLTLGQALLRVPLFPSVSVIPSIVHFHSFMVDAIYIRNGAIVNHLERLSEQDIFRAKFVDKILQLNFT
jgi:hypothetical protein